LSQWSTSTLTGLLLWSGFIGGNMDKNEHDIEKIKLKNEDRQNQRDFDFKCLKVGRITQSFDHIVGLSIRGVVSIGLLYWAYHIIHDMMNPTLTLNILGVKSLSNVLAWLLTIASCVWAISERTLRHKITKNMTAGLLEWERSHDPNRGSSELTKTGKTNPEDKV